MDGRAGVTALDEEVADHLRRSSKPVVLCVNKVEDQGRFGDGREFYTLGLDPILFLRSTGAMWVTS